jgi:hypothetical protein
MLALRRVMMKPLRPANGGKLCEGSGGSGGFAGGSVRNQLPHSLLFVPDELVL